MRETMNAKGLNMVLRIFGITWQWFRHCLEMTPAWCCHDSGMVLTGFKHDDVMTTTTERTTVRTDRGRTATIGRTTKRKDGQRTDDDGTDDCTYRWGQHDDGDGTDTTRRMTYIVLKFRIRHWDQYPKVPICRPRLVVSDHPEQKSAG